MSRRRELEAGCTGRYHWPIRSLFERDGRRCNLDISEWRSNLWIFLFEFRSTPVVTVSSKRAFARREERGELLQGLNIRIVLSVTPWCR